ncbi:hypothetical protein TI39_contig950g00008 [Zymoseptoria brevis]|uniref:NTF2-like domain-containing protein n=1 Tax=Zymoseptoria brevis TaxID=1047168 RepID=A0A0F4GI57_9PEZI|nr:hypothetical protein TI39_contig950g00008 [Zymoseptoria brevis]
MFVSLALLTTLLTLILPSIAKCLCDETANNVALNFQHLFQDYSPEYVDTVLAVDFTDQTDSVAWLISNGTDCPKQLGVPTLTGLAEFKAAQESQPNLPFPILNVFHNCDSVFVRWKFDILPQQVQGIAILNTIPNPDSRAARTQPFLIKNVFSEFNTGAFTHNLGWFNGTSPCEGNEKRECLKQGWAVGVAM